MSVNKSSEIKLDVWIIHTGCPYYTINRPDLDPETNELMQVVAKGREALATDSRTRDLKVKKYAAESLEYSEEREENMKCFVADSQGTFYTKSPEEARTIWDMVKNDKSPAPYLDPRSPEIPGADKPAPTSAAAAASVTPRNTLNRSI